MKDLFKTQFTSANYTPSISAPDPTTNFKVTVLRYSQKFLPKWYVEQSVDEGKTWEMASPLITGNETVTITDNRPIDYRVVVQSIGKAGSVTVRAWQG